MNKPKITIIVPVYNAEQYLQRCVDSILVQTFTDFELLLIDDGSKDKSGGCCVVSTEYFAFVDSDDFIDKHYLALLLREITSAQSDMAVCAYYEMGQNGSMICGDTPYDKISFIKALLLAKEWGVLWNKLFKKKIVDDNSISFIEHLHIWEDLAFVIEYLLACSVISFVKEPLYSYDRTIVGSLTKKDSISYYKEIIDAVNKIEYVISKYGYSDLFCKE